LGRKLSQFFGRPEKLPQGKVFSGKLKIEEAFDNKIGYLQFYRKGNLADVF
jgi:hypothetical protein